MKFNQSHHQEILVSLLYQDVVDGLCSSESRWKIRNGGGFRGLVVSRTSFFEEEESKRALIYKVVGNKFDQIAKGYWIQSPTKWIVHFAGGTIIDTKYIPN